MIFFKKNSQWGPTGGSSKGSGVGYQSLDYRFQLSNERKHIMNYEINVQMVEIYYEQVRDLLGGEYSTNKYLENKNYCTENGSSLSEVTMHRYIQMFNLF